MTRPSTDDKSPQVRDLAWQLKFLPKPTGPTITGKPVAGTQADAAAAHSSCHVPATTRVIRPISKTPAPESAWSIMPNLSIVRYLLATVCWFVTVPWFDVNANDPSWHAGVAKVGVTPTEPVRMAGYGNRSRPSEGVDSPLAVRSVALRHVSSQRPLKTDHSDTLLVVAIDTIGLPGSLAREINQRLEKRFSVPRRNVVLTSTHTHCGPDLISELSNIFSTPMTDAEIAAGLRYKAKLVDAIVESVERAIADLRPASVDYGIGKVSFAANRRVLVGGRWTAFGVQSDGPVDHALPVLRISDPDGKLRGVVFNYACHGTTLSGDHYRINGDWSGFASEALEANSPGIVALSTIGCGADANPEPRGALEYAVAHGNAMAAEVARVIAAPMQPITEVADTRLDHAALTFELPTIEEVRGRIDDKNPQISRHAKRLDEIYRSEGRLPATYPVPIQSWQFGDQLTMVFIGGEVVVDYALRLKRELANDRLWVTAYTGDVLGYIASERMRHEGGYEFDRSAIYYGLPGPWASGTEDHLVSSIRRMIESRRVVSPVSAKEAESTMRLSTDQFRIELVAAEPLVQDPINIAFGHDGKLWVVEMGDYPTGDRGGRVKFLTDSSGDGRYDTATVFIDGLTFPTGVFPWRDGVIVSAAPEIFFARDTTGDGKADQIETLYTGFRLSNPQHRISGFTYGLDHSLHCASGDNLSELRAVKTGETINASGHDVQIWPDSGKIGLTSGRTQFIRARDDFGQWFGNDNSRPMWHYPIDARHLARNPSVIRTGNVKQLFSPPVAPPVFPATASDARFNDLYAAGRFTSACSSIVARSSSFDFNGQKSAFICEPVHNLVHRTVLADDGSSFVAARHPAEKATEFLASTDPWFRPVRCEIGPEGGLWVVDMYRETIEHPQWIPQAWQAQLDLYAGNDRGRIYRIVPTTDASPQAFAPLADLPPSQWIAALNQPSGTTRDTAMRLLVEAGAEKLTTADFGALRDLARDDNSPVGRVGAIATLETLRRYDDEIILAALSASDPGVIQFAVDRATGRLAGPQSERFLKVFLHLADHPSPRVAMAVALGCGDSDHELAGQTLAKIAARSDVDRWLAAGILSSARPHSRSILQALIGTNDTVELSLSDEKRQLISGLIETAIANRADVQSLISTILQPIDPLDSDNFDGQLALASSVARSLAKIDGRSPAADQWRSLLRPIHERAQVIVADPGQPPTRRLAAMEMFGHAIGDQAVEKEKQLLAELLAASVPPEVQSKAVETLARIDHDGLVDLALAKWESLSTSIRDRCVGQMLARAPSIERLLDEIESGKIQANQLSAAARQQLLHSGSRSLMVRAQRLVQSNAAAGSPEKQRLIERYLADFRSSAAQTSPGGLALYTKHCAGCHQADEQGKTIGPSLMNLSDRRDRTLVEAILDPNKAVEPQYQSYLIRTDDDQLIVGAIESESTDVITLARADGTRAVVQRDRIAEVKNSGVSLMPDGFAEIISPSELQAIVVYLQSQKQP